MEKLQKSIASLTDIFTLENGLQYEILKSLEFIVWILHNDFDCALKQNKICKELADHQELSTILHKKSTKMHFT